MNTSIRQQVFYAFSPEAVWDYLTKAELLAQWLMKNDFQLVLGHEFQFRTNPLPKFDFDGIAYCKVLEIIPFKKLSYSWKGGPGNGRMSLDSVVVWTLVEKNNGTELLLEHSGFKDIENVAIYHAMAEGWLRNMQKIADYLNAIKDNTRSMNA